jgi:RNA ligase (TIGR02306 family)
MRSLASVKVIDLIRPIPGADKIEVADIGGWSIVVAKDIYKPEQKVIMCEIDSVLPIKPEFECLRKSCHVKLADGSEGFRIKTIKLRGQVSQGFIVPLISETLEVGTDVTELLGIKKYEPQIFSNGKWSTEWGKPKGSFPAFLIKTDEERVQNISNEIEKHRTANTQFYVTEKIDGTSFTCYKRINTLGEVKFGVCSRNMELMETEECIYWKVARKYNLEYILKSVPYNIAIQGEIIGPKIQKNLYKLDELKLYVFNVFIIDEMKYMGYDEFIGVCQQFGLCTVPVIDTSVYLPGDVKTVLKFAEGKSTLANVDREGVVFRTLGSNRFSFKAISNIWLLKHD